MPRCAACNVLLACVHRISVRPRRDKGAIGTFMQAAAAPVNDLELQTPIHIPA